MSKQPFLKQLAEKSYHTFGRELDTLTLVFPNRRAGLFYRQYLSGYVSEPIWSPAILTLEDFILERSELQEVAPLKSIFSLYRTYKGLVDHAESFDKFYYWGNLILNDFNDVDNYLIDADHIFQVISSQKELDEAFYYLPEDDQRVIKSFWAGFLPRSTKNQASFLNTWKVLKPLYARFRDLLKDEGVGYKGMIYRDVAESLPDIPKDHEVNKIWFAGFNALNKAEQKIIKHFISNSSADIFWDVDAYYIKNFEQEAGHFFREYANDPILKTSINHELPDRLNNPGKTVGVTSVALEEGQVKALASKLNEISKSPKFNPQTTAIILPDEHLLTAVLNSIPQHIEHINVTMGYPLKNTQHFILFEMLIELYANTKASELFKIVWNHRNVLSILKSPIIKEVLGHKGDELKKHIVTENRSFIHYDEIEKVIGTESSKLFMPRPLLEQIEYFIALCEELTKPNTPTIEHAALFEMQKVFGQIKEELSGQSFEIKYDSFLKLWRQLGRGLKVPFVGEPLEGIQVMGVLETRNLDFEHIFILSMNEGKWPGDSHESSFIPFNIRKAFDLPVVEHRDALQSYLFYRLLHHSKTLDVYYNNISEFNYSGELSRLIKQLDFESKITVEHRSLVNKVGMKGRQEISIPKGAEILKKLERFLVHDTQRYDRLSPSALNVYLDCRLKFYFQHIEIIKEIEKVDDDLNPAQFGNLLHQAMEELYGLKVNDGRIAEITSNDISEIRKEIKSAIDKAFTHYGLGTDDNNKSQDGRSIIAGRVIEKYIEAILSNDAEYAPFEIVGLEAGQQEGYKLDVPIEYNGIRALVGLKGIIDRIDHKDGVVRILDYKSGKDERKTKDIESLFDRTYKKRNKAIMQVLFYCLLFKTKGHYESSILIPGLFNSRDLFKSDFDIRITLGKQLVEDFSTVEQVYYDQLASLVQEIYDPNVLIDQTEDLKKCSYCAYANICMRN